MHHLFIVKLPLQKWPPARNGLWWWGLIPGCVPKPTLLDISSADGELSALNSWYSHTAWDSAATRCRRRPKLWMNNHVDDSVWRFSRSVWNLGFWICQVLLQAVLTASRTLTSFTSTESLCAALTHSNFTLEDNGAACSSVLELHYFFTTVVHALYHTLLKAKRLEEVIGAKSTFALISHSLRGWKKERNLAGIFNQHAAND